LTFITPDQNTQNVRIEVSVPPPSNAIQEKKTNEQVSREAKPGFVESAMAKGLISQARQLEVAGDKASSDQASLLWEQALKLGGLSAPDELLCHYYLGSYYFSRENVREGIKHHQRVALSDPNLTFLQDINEASKNKLTGDLYENLSTGYQSLARTEAKEKKGTKAAIDYLQAKVNILGHMAAPSILFDLGSYYSLYGNGEKAKEIMRNALEAPTYGSAFQENAKKLAEDFLQKRDILDGTKEGREERLKIDQPLALGPESERKKPPLLKWIAATTVVVAAALVLILLLRPSQYSKYYSRAQELYQSGKYEEAMGLALLAKEIKATNEIATLEGLIRAKTQEIKAKEEKEKLQQEYDTYYRRAVESYNNNNLKEAKLFAELAGQRQKTREVLSLEEKIQIKLQEPKEEIGANEGDDAAYGYAAYADNETSYSGYLRSFPEGKHAAEARAKLAALKGGQAPQQNNEANPQEIQRQQIQDNAVTDVAGNWQMITNPGARRERREPLFITQNGTMLRIQMRQGDQTETCTGWINGDQVSWTNSRTTLDGQATIVYNAIVHGDKMTGTINLHSVTTPSSIIRTIPWSAERKSN